MYCSVLHRSCFAVLKTSTVSLIKYCPYYTVCSRRSLVRHFCHNMAQAPVTPGPGAIIQDPLRAPQLVHFRVASWSPLERLNGENARRLELLFGCYSRCSDTWDKPTACVGSELCAFCASLIGRMDVGPGSGIAWSCGRVPTQSTFVWAAIYADP